MKKAVTLGNFDGVHRGHQKLIELVNSFKREKISKGENWISLAVSFEPHPVEVLKPGVRVPRLTQTPQKIAELNKLGIDQVEIIPFDLEFSQISPSYFFENYLLKKHSMGFLCVGDNFFFGKDRQGNPQVLESLCKAHSIPLSIVKPIESDGEKISSSRIRALIGEGQMVPAARLLGRDYSITGEVIHGDKRGRQLGFPTANILPDLVSIGSICVPARGVYLSVSTVEGRTFPSITNVGVKPTVSLQGAPLVIETHLLDFAGDLYGKMLTVEFKDRLRDERKFKGVDELLQQIRIDTAIAREKLRSL